MKRTILVSAAFFAWSGVAAAQDWSCSNTEFEISCADGACDAAESFTPMSVSVGRENIQICAYTACMSGEVTSYSQAGDLVLFATDKLVHENPLYSVDGVGNAAIVIDETTGGALIHSVFQTPMMCTRIEPVDD